MAKDCPHHVFKPIPISVVKGGSQSCCGISRAARGRERGTHNGGQSVVQYGRKGCQCYAMPIIPEVESSATIIIGIILICYKYTFILLDPELTISCVSTHIASIFGIVCEPLSKPLYVSTLVGDSLVVD